MTLKTFKKLIAQLPKELDSYDVVYSKFDSLEEGKWRKESRSIDMLLFDQDSAEILLLDETTAKELDKT